MEENHLQSIHEKQRMLEWSQNWFVSSWQK